MPEKINPYIAGAPVTETRMFFGREDVFSWIERSLSGKFVDHILVVHGQRRVGKTSVLKHLGNRLPKNFIPIFIDLQGRVNITLPRFLWWLAREITRALDLPDPERARFEEDPDYFESEFLPGVEGQLGDKVLLLTFDEFDTLETTTAQEGLALPFMAILKRLMDHRGLNFIFSIGSSGRKLENMQAAYTSFFKQALYRKISFLDEQDARELIAKPVEGVMQYDLDAVDLIYEITSGHPYFIQLICHELFSVCQKTNDWQVSKADVEGILDAVIERGTVNLKFVWDESSELEKWVLASLAQFEANVDVETLGKFLKDQKVRFIQQDLESAILHLREKDVLASGNRFVIYLMKLWLIQNRSIEQVREELSKVNPIVSRLLQVGHEYLDQGDLQKAIDAFQEALQSEEDNLEVRLGLAGAYMAREDFGRAAAEYEEILILHPEDVAAQSGYCDAYLALGDFRIAMGRLDEAEYAYQQALKINPRHADGRKRMARLYHHHAVNAISGAEDTALEQVRMALEFTPDDDLLQASANELEALASGKREKKEVLLDWGKRAAKKENWQDAADLLEAYQRLQGKDESAPPALVDIRQKATEEQLNNLRKQAERMERLEDYDEALLALNKYLALQPEDADQIPQRIQQLKEARKQAQLREGKGERKPFWKQPLAWVGLTVVAALALLLAIPTSPLRAALAPAAPTGQVTERVVVATAEPTIAPTPSPTPLPFKWTRVNSIQFLDRDAVSVVAIHPEDADIIYAGSENSGMYRSNDGGVSWLPASTGITGGEIQQILVDPQEPDTVYAGVKSLGFFKTDDGGDSWHRLDPKSISPEDRISYLTMDPSNAAHLAYTDGAGIWESMDKGETWLRLDIPFENPGLVAIDPDSGNMIAAAGINENDGADIQLFLSNEQRSDWQLTYEFYASWVNFNYIIYDPLREISLLNIGRDDLVTRDGGQTWEPGIGDEGFVISADGDYYSADGGSPIVSINKKITKRITNYNIGINSLDVALSNSDRIVVGSTYGIWISDNGGDKWYERTSGLGAIEATFGFDLETPTIYLGQMKEPVYPNVSERRAGIGNFYSYDLSDNSFRDISTSLCGTYQTQPWEQAVCHEYPSKIEIIDGVTTYVRAYSVSPRNENTVYLATDNGVYLSSDGGGSWDAINDGFGNMRIVYDLAFDPQNPEDLYALTPYGIYKLEAK